MNNETIDQLPTANTIDAVNDLLPIYQNSSISTFSINRNTYLGLSSQPVGISDSQTMTNKTLTSPTISGPTLSGTLTGTYTIGGTPTFPSSVVQLTTPQTLTNKTLTSPTITSPTITNATISADAVTGFTTPNSGTIYGIAIASSVISAPNSVSGGALTSNSVSGTPLENAIITPNKLNLGLQAAATATSGTTTATSFTSTLSGSTAQTVTVTVGANGILLVGIWGQISNSGASLSAMSFALSGANTVAASNSHAVAVSNTSTMWLGNTFALTGLTAGSTVITMNFAVSGGTGTYGAQNLWAVPF